MTKNNFSKFVAFLVIIITLSIYIILNIEPLQVDEATEQADFQNIRNALDDFPKIEQVGWYDFSVLIYDFHSCLVRFRFAMRQA